MKDFDKNTGFMIIVNKGNKYGIRIINVFSQLMWMGVLRIKEQKFYRAKGLRFNSKLGVDLYNQKLFQNNFQIIIMNTNKFIVKLISMMREFPQILNWSKDGQEMEIFDIQKFQSQVHPKYFTSTNYQSFLRQLNMYSFKKMSKRKNSVNFRHLIFKKGNQAQFQQIKRKQRQFKTKKLTQNRPKRTIQRARINLSIIDDKSPLQTSIKQLPRCIQQTIALIKKQMPPSGLNLIQRLQTLLMASHKKDPQFQNSNSSMAQPNESIKEFASFCKLQDILNSRRDPPDLSFDFDDNASRQSFQEEEQSIKLFVSS